MVVVVMVWFGFASESRVSYLVFQMLGLQAYVATAHISYKLKSTKGKTYARPGGEGGGRSFEVSSLVSYTKMYVSIPEMIVTTVQTTQALAISYRAVFPYC